MILLAVLLVLGLCGFSTRGVPLLREMIAATSPLNLVFLSLRPEDLMGARAGKMDLNGGLVVGAVIAAGVYAGIVYGMHQSMKRSFMMTVRRLAGTR
jgi:hypothetical protein